MGPPTPLRPTCGPEHTWESSQGFPQSPGPPQGWGIPGLLGVGVGAAEAGTRLRAPPPPVWVSDSASAPVVSPLSVLRAPGAASLRRHPGARAPKGPLLSARLCFWKKTSGGWLLSRSCCEPQASNYVASRVRAFGSAGAVEPQPRPRCHPGDTPAPESSGVEQKPQPLQGRVAATQEARRFQPGG